MSVVKKGLKPRVIIFNVVTIIVAILTALVAAFTDNQVLLEEFMTPEAFGYLAAFMGGVSVALQKIGKVKGAVDSVKDAKPSGSEPPKK